MTGQIEEMAAGEEFVRTADSFRRELLAHCYRMMGSVHDAEDLVQETYLRAWRSHRDYQHRSSLRTWLYRIATNVCLTALERSARRPLPAGLGGPSADPSGPLAPERPEIPWLQPIPDALLDPAAIVATRDRIRLALVATLQYLPPRQRAVLILRDVLGWRATEVAELLDTTTAAVNSTLQRARVQLARVAPAEDETVVPDDAEHRALVDRYVRAIEDGDVKMLTGLLRADVELEMPPNTTWFAGNKAVLGFFESRIFAELRSWRVVRTAANGQPATATYGLGDDGAYRAHSIQVLTLKDGRISRIVAFRDLGLFPIFQLPPTHSA